MDNGTQPASTTSLPVATNEPSVEDIADLHATAVKARSNGRFAEAAELFGRLIKIEPENPSFHYLAGKVEHDRGDFDSAIDHLSRANRLYAHSADIHVSLGVAHGELENYVEASDWYRSALALDPDFAPAFFNLGLLLLRVERYDDAALCFERIAQGADANASAIMNLARARRGQKRFTEAIDLLKQSLTRDPDLVGADELLGVCCRELGRHAEAEAAFRAALKRDRDNPNILYNLTYALLDQARIEDAFRYARQSVEANSDSALAQMALGHVYDILKQPDQRMVHLRRALALEPDNLGVKMNVGKALESAWKPDEALAVYLDVVSKDPGFEDALARCVEATMSLGRWGKYDALLSTLRSVIEEESAHDDTPKVLAFNLQALPVGYDVISQSARLASKALKRRENVSEYRFGFNQRTHDKLRIGYLLPYTWWHSLPMVLKPVIEAHPRDRIELHGYSVRPDNDTRFSASYRAAFDHFSDVSNLPFGESAQRIHADGIDILIDVSGHTNISCLPIMAHRPAPVQAHFLGYSITNGADFIDYLITDREFMPPELARFNSEKSVYLPGSFMIAPRIRAAATPPSRADQGLADDAFVFANFNHPCKFEPEIFATWMRILKRVPGAVLWCGAWIDVSKHNLRAEAERQGVAGSLMIFAKQIDRDQHCARLALADLALDTYYHGGGITSIDALSAGVPLLSAVWQTPSSRMGTTLLNAVGMRDFVCRDLREYEDRAVHLAHAPDELATMRAALSRAVDTSALFDVDLYARHLEGAYHLMWENFVDGNDPQNIEVPQIVDIPTPRAR